MKKTLVTLLAAAAVVASSYGQGTVTFSASSGTFKVNKEAVPGSGIFNTAVPSSDGAKVVLLWAPVGTTDVALFSAVGALVNVGTPVAGYFSGGTRTIPAGSGATGIAPGGQVALVVQGFIGTDYANASLRGYSPIFTVTTGNPISTPAGTPTPINAVWGGLNLAQVPEPTSMALAGLGAASLLIFRRRK